MLIAGPLIIGGTAYLVTDHNAVQNLTSSVQQLKDDMKSQFASVHTEIANLPDMPRRVTELERTSHETDGRVNDLTSRVSKVEGLLQPTPSFRRPQ
jgi:uncharacterized protein YoxC